MSVVYLIGLTGGIAAGKSVVARRLAEHGAVHIDADQLAREVVQPGTPALHAIVSHFGQGILLTDGTLDRSALGNIIFADVAARERLNGIVHPAIRELTIERVAEASASNPDAIVVYDVPLLAESPVAQAFDLVVVAHAPRETRIARLVTLRKMSRADATARVNSQATDAERLKIADVVIDTDGTLESTLAQTDELWESVRARSGSIQ